MTIVDGHYRYNGVMLSWDCEGVMVAKRSESDAVRTAWQEIYGVRHLGEKPGYVQIRVRDHLPLSDPDHDPFTIPVASEADANRLLTSFRWRAAPAAPGRRRRQRGHAGRLVSRRLLRFGRSSAS
jgi:hypothetical protein